jgi:hypothetical protein
MATNCRIHDDNWHHLGKTYFVHEAKTRENSTAVDLTLEDDRGVIISITVANHQIEWIEENA